MNFTVYFYSAGLQALLAEGILAFDIMWKIKVPSTYNKCYITDQKKSKCKSDTKLPELHVYGTLHSPFCI